GNVRTIERKSLPLRPRLDNQQIQQKLLKEDNIRLDEHGQTVQPVWFLPKMVSVARTMIHQMQI
ncbi:115_t:CDS:1, partial [Paraglomus brasilianum]